MARRSGRGCTVWPIASRRGSDRARSGARPKTKGARPEAVQSACDLERRELRT